MGHQVHCLACSWVENCPDLLAVQDRLARTAPQSSARERVVWADDFAIHTLCEELGLGVLIINDAAKRPTRGSADSVSKFLKVLPEADAGNRFYVVFRKSRREHYDLLRVEGVTVLEQPVLQRVKEVWRLSP